MDRKYDVISDAGGHGRGMATETGETSLKNVSIPPPCPSESDITQDSSWLSKITMLPLLCAIVVLMAAPSG